MFEIKTLKNLTICQTQYANFITNFTYDKNETIFESGL